jgi:phage shock protein C
MGVCAGIADYLDIKVGVVRVLVVLGALVTGIWFFAIAYFILGFVLDPMPRDLYQDEREEEFWKQTRKAPDYTAAELRRRFRDIERRTSDMEAYMTSKRFRLERELKSLED